MVWTGQSVPDVSLALLSFAALAVANTSCPPGRIAQGFSGDAGNYTAGRASRVRFRVPVAKSRLTAAVRRPSPRSKVLRGTRHTETRASLTPLSSIPGSLVGSGCPSLIAPPMLLDMRLSRLVVMDAPHIHPNQRQKADSKCSKHDQDHKKSSTLHCFYLREPTVQLLSQAALGTKTTELGGQRTPP